MTNITKWQWIIVSIILLVIVSAYSFFTYEQPVTGYVEFTRQGADIILDKPAEIEKVLIKDEYGQTLSTVTLGPGKRQKAPVFIKWDNNKKYAFNLLLPNGRSVILTEYSPSAESEKVSLTFEAPYGLDNSAGAGIIPVDSTFIANLLVINHDTQPISLNIDLKIPEGVEIERVPEGMNQEKIGSIVHITGQHSLGAKNEHWNEQIYLKALHSGEMPELKLTVIVDDGQEQWQITKQTEIIVASVSDIGDKIRILSVELPVDLSGKYDPKVSAGTLIYTPPGILAQLTGTDISFDDDPFAYAKVTVGNDGDENILALITGKILDTADNKLALTFKSPPHKNAGLGYSYAAVAIPPRSSKQVVLPIYIDENNVIGGTYLFKAETSIFGTSQIIATAEEAIYLNPRNDRPLTITLFMALIALLGIIWLLWKREAVLNRFTTKELVIISLFGTVTFVTVNLPQTILWDIARVILGPFSFFITGFFSQTMLFTLIIALVTILPKPGTITMMLIIRFILSAFIFGNFSPTQILSYTTLAAFLEIILYVLGVTRSPAKAGHFNNTVMIALVCGIIDIITSYMNFMSFMILYRLFYADWYIFSALAAGFIYTIAGAGVGRQLGENLRKTAMD